MATLFDMFNAGDSCGALLGELSSYRVLGSYAGAYVLQYGRLVAAMLAAGTASYHCGTRDGLYRFNKDSLVANLMHCYHCLFPAVHRSHCKALMRLETFVPVGGAWTIGYKAWGALLGRRLCEQGVMVACLDYRNFPQVRFGRELTDGPVCSILSNWTVVLGIPGWQLVQSSTLGAI